MRTKEVYAYWSCFRKVKYYSREEATAKGFRVYKCKNCKGFHRASIKSQKQKESSNG